MIRSFQGGRSLEIRAYIYSRYSTAKQSKGDSLRRQHEECFKFASELGVPIDTSLPPDKGISGFKGFNRIRGALGSFIKRVEAGEIARGSYLLVDSMDRISREDETQVLNLLTSLSLAGIRLCNVSERHVLPDKPDMTDWIRLLVHASRSHQESVEKARKVRKAHQDSKARAQTEGFRWHRTGPTWLRAEQIGSGRTKKITFHEIDEKVAAVRQAFDLFQGGVGSSSIAQQFNERRIPAPRGGQWHHSTVLEILKNRSVLGEYQPRTYVDGNRGSRRPPEGLPVDGYFPAIVGASQFHAVQKLLVDRRPKRGGPSQKTFTNLFQGFGRCATCGGNVGISTPPKRNGWKATSVMRCNVAIRHAIGPVGREPCDNMQRYPYEPLEKAILSMVADFEIPDTEKSGPSISEIEELVSDINDIESKITKALEMQLENKADQFVQRRYAALMIEHEAKAEKLQKMRGAATIVQVPASDRQEAIRRLFERMDQSDGVERYNLRASLHASLRLIIDWISFDDDKTVDVILHGGDKAYRFRNGTFLSEYDVRGLRPT